MCLPSRVGNFYHLKSEKWILGGNFLYKLIIFLRVLLGFVCLEAKMHPDCTMIVAKWFENYLVGAKMLHTN